ncbi:MAG: FliH/SctL family protein [Candidatus Nucleicultricaceae bacterium]
MNLLDKAMESTEGKKFIVKKFLFEDDFTIPHEEGVIPVDVVEEQQPIIDHYALELEEKYKEGYQQGQSDAEQEKKALAEQRLARLFETVHNTLETLHADQKEIALAYEVMMMKILEKMVTKVFPELLKEKGFDELFGFIKMILSEEHKATDFLLYVAPSEKGMLEQSIKKMQIQGQKKITVVEELSLEEGECRLEFDETSIERSTERIMDGVLKAIGRFKVMDQSNNHPEENAAPINSDDPVVSKTQDLGEEGGTNV